MTRRSLMRAILAALAVAPLAACGRRGNPIVPEGGDFPGHYPWIGFPGNDEKPKPKPKFEDLE